MPSKRGSFVHLHNHGGNSLLDGLSTLDAMCERAAEMDQPAIALTEHGNPGGAWKFAKAAAKHGVKSIQGIEAYLSFGSRHDRESIEAIDDEAGESEDVAEGDDAKARKTKRKTYQHLTVLAENEAGWKSLVAANNASQDSFWFKPRMDLPLLAEHSEGLIILTGCVGGPVAGELLRGNPDKAQENLRSMIDAHGTDNVFVEIMDHGVAFDRRVNEELIALARDVFGPSLYRQRIVATNDSHYVREEQAISHEAWLCGQTNAQLSEPTKAEGGKRFAFQGDGYFLRTADQMRRIFDTYEGAELACDNTLVIAERVQADVLPKPGIRLPRFPLPAQLSDGTPFSGTARDLLYAEVKIGAIRRWGQNLPLHVRKRLRYEFDVLDALSEKLEGDAYLGTYLLIVWDLILWARANGIRVGPGRGSAAGSAISYALGIVNVDPIANNLLFERFLDIERVGMPDIDTDYDVEGRDRVIDYAARKYGVDHLARIGTYGISLSKASIKRAAKALGLRTAGERISKRVPTGGGGKPLPFKDLINEDDSRGADFRQTVAATEGGEAIIKLARDFEGVIATDGIHACGVLISDEPLGQLIPLRRDRRAKGGTGGWVTQWDGKDIDDLGLMKIDFLGLRNLDIESGAVQQIQARTGELVDTDALPTDSADERVRRTWDLLAEGNTAGVFQLESEGMKRLIQRIQPDSMDDLSAVVALYRPGPLGAQMHDRYAERKAGAERVDYAIYTDDAAEQDAIASVLGETYGTVVYQEALMRLGTVIAGFGPAVTNKLRKAISKKVPAEIAAIKALFLDGAQADRDDAGEPKMRFRLATAEALWRAFEKSGDYLFNKCLTGDTVVTDGSRSTTIAELYGNLGASPTLLSYDFSDGRIRPKPVKTVHCNGERQVWRIVLADGKRIRATENHRLLSDGRWTPVSDLRAGLRLATWAGGDHSVGSSEIVEIAFDGIEMTYDVEMDDENHNFVANGIVSHNSHSAAYGQISYETAFLKANWPGPYGAALLSATEDDDRRHAAMLALRAEGIVIKAPDINTGLYGTTVDADGAVLLGMGEIQGVKSNARAIIAERNANGPFASLADLVNRVKIADEKGAQRNLSIGIVDALIEAGACDSFGPRRGLSMTVRGLRANPDLPILDAEWSVSERSMRERQRLGVCVSEHPLSVTGIKDQLSTWREANRNSIPQPLHRIVADDGDSVVTLGIATSWTEMSTKAGKRMAKMSLESSATSIECVVFPSVYAEHASGGAIPRVGDIIGISGRMQVSRIVKRMSGETSDDDLDFDGDDDSDVEIAVEVIERRELLVDRIWRGPLVDEGSISLPAADRRFAPGLPVLELPAPATRSKAAAKTVAASGDHGATAAAGSEPVSVEAAGKAKARADALNGDILVLWNRGNRWKPTTTQFSDLLTSSFGVTRTIRGHIREWCADPESPLPAPTLNGAGATLHFMSSDDPQDGMQRLEATINELMGGPAAEMVA